MGPARSLLAVPDRCRDGGIIEELRDAGRVGLALAAGTVDGDAAPADRRTRVGGPGGRRVVTLEPGFDDGEKEYAVDPRYRADDSTSDGSVEVSAPFGTVGANLDCSNGECRVTPQGVIEPPENPAIPAPIWDGED